MDGRNVEVCDDGMVVYRASALGNCTMSLVASRLGYDEVKGQTSQMGEGELHEGDVLERMRGQGWGIGNRQGVVVLPITSKIIVRGHIDAEGWKNDGCGISASIISPHERPEVVVDVKSQSADAWDDFERNGWESGFFPKYKWQFSAYMLALGLPGLLARKNRNSGEVKYEMIESPFYTLEDIRRRVLGIEAWAVRGELPEKCDTKMFPCPVFYLHDEGVREIVDDKVVSVIARQYEEARVQAKVIKGKVEASRRALREALGLRVEDGQVVGENLRSQTMDGVAITFYNQTNPPSTDWEKVYAALEVSEEEFRAQYTKQSKSERVKVTLPKSEMSDDKRGTNG